MRDHAILRPIYPKRGRWFGRRKFALTRTVALAGLGADETHSAFGALVKTLRQRCLVVRSAKGDDVEMLRPGMPRLALVTALLGFALVLGVSRSLRMARGRSCSGGRIEREGEAWARVPGAHGLAWPVPGVVIALGPDVLVFLDAESGDVLPRVVEWSDGSAQRSSASRSACGLGNRASGSGCSPF